MNNSLGMYGRYKVVNHGGGKFTVWDNFNEGHCTPYMPKIVANKKCEELADQWVLNWCPEYPEESEMKREAIARIREKQAKRMWQREINKLIGDG